LHLWLGDWPDENLSFDKIAERFWTPQRGAPQG
jgi:hypothetical protein